MDVILVIAAVGVFMLVSMAEQRVERERRRIAETEPSGQGHQLSHYELAHLSGGPRRAINTALAVLATAGAIRVSRTSEVTLVQGARPSPEPIEQAVLDALAARPGGCRAGELRRELETHPAFIRLAATLEQRGLIVPEGAYVTAWRRLDLIRIALGVAVAYLVLLFVLAGAGVAGVKPSFLGALLFSGFSVVFGFAALHRQKRRLRNVVTREGRAVLHSARGHHPRGERDHGTLALSVGVPVALYGLYDAGDQALCDGLSAGDPRGDCTGSCGTYGGDGGSTFGADSYGGFDFGGGGSSSCGGSSGCGGGGGGGGGGCGGGGS
ncbi:TIGR04222 domain-containing membrane protein [Nonomuraea sp. NPDC050404]|uniref:TIGR04222 domain-containing membrane protein n=1 Tax=Nonomuraea sp. NPDC050404 TaxID=3155783 RepID=UPI00341087AE